MGLSKYNCYNLVDNFKQLLLKGTTVLFLCFLAVFNAKAQTIPVGTAAIEDYYRRAQLAGRLDSTVSFNVRPINPRKITGNKDLFFPDSLSERTNLLNINGSYESLNKKLTFSLLPVTLLTQFNSDHPYGWNDGPMIPARGFQTVLSAGFFAEYGPLTIQFKPELINAANTDFETFDKDHYEIIFAQYYDFYNQIDAPVRFGTSKYSKVRWGQSSIKLNYKAFSAGISTENLWWGPGMRNSLVMSNTAPGFKHLTINTRRPVKTPIGSFEGQIIAGKLEGSGFAPLEPDYLYFNSSLYLPKKADWRLLSGLVLSWQPKWVPGLFVGLSRSAQMYASDVSSLGDVLPFFSSKKVGNTSEPLETKDQRSSIFLRWLWTAAQAEFYFEYGHSNNLQNARAAALQPDRSRGYLAGIRKLMPFSAAKGSSLLFELEVAQLQQTQVDAIFNRKSWYLHPYVRHGYTNQGEIIGAGIGPGANLQSFQLSWVKGIKRLGLQVERLVHNNDFYFYSFIGSQDQRRHWVDFSLAASGEIDFKNFIFNGKLQAIKSINYQYYLLQEPTATNYWVNGRDAFNMQLQLGVSYRF